MSETEDLPKREKRYAAVDIGSNAVRLLIAHIGHDANGDIKVHKDMLIRMPVRLGKDVFTTGKVSDSIANKLALSLQGFSLLVNVYEVDGFKICATSALREAENGTEVIAKVKEISGLDITIIEGSEEARLIVATQSAEAIAPDHDYLFVDVGGGSTELTLFIDHIWRASKSFKVGTVRALEGIVDKKEIHEMRVWIEHHTKDPTRGLVAIGTGGNINKLQRLAKSKEDKPLRRSTLAVLHKRLADYTVEERIDLMGLRPDRADVIVPATEIYYSVMKWAGITEIYVPRTGLADGVVRAMYEGRM